MTETRRWLEDRRRELWRRKAGASVALNVGLVLIVLAVGVTLGRVGIYQSAPVLVLGAWLAALAAAAWGVRQLWVHRTRLAVAALAREVEHRGGARLGLVAGAAAGPPAGGSRSLAAAADRRVAAWLADHGMDALAGARAEARRSLLAGGLVLAAGTSLLIVSQPGSARGAELWHPLAVLTRGRGPVELSVDRDEVRRGESVNVTVSAVGRRHAALWTRAPGEPWSERPLALDSSGVRSFQLGPLDSDRFLRAASGGRTSKTIHVRVSLPALLTDFQLTARFPDYMERLDQPIVADGDTVLLPVGTSVTVEGEATVDLASAAWRSEHQAVPLEVSGAALRGSLVVRATARWRLDILTRAGGGGGALEGDPPELVIVAVRDSAPLVAVPVPGVDTVAPLTLQLPIVIDARDDHRLVMVDLVSWRVGRTGVRSEEVREGIPLPEGGGGTERAVLHWNLDLNGRGFLPGDTAYYKVQARDNAPESQLGESRVFALRLRSMSELRRATREASRGVMATADSLAEAQRDLARAIEDVAAERNRGAADRGGNQLRFASVERARELLADQEALAGRARELRDRLRELSDAAWSAGVTDPEFHRQLRELEELLERALTEELQERLEELRRALEQLEAPAVRDALERLARAAQELREELERSRELLQRAAIEGEMTTLAQDVEELAERQAQWNDSAAGGVDSTLAEAENMLAAEAEKLAAELSELQAAIDSAGLEGGVASAERGTRDAAAHMRQAAHRGRTGDQRGARRSGEAASESLDPVAEDLRAERERLRDEWRREVLAAMDRALVETAQLASAQEAVQHRLSRGESGADVRGAQAAAREGIDRLIDRLQRAAGKNALVSPRLGAELGLAKGKMSGALEQLQSPSPNTRSAAAQAGQALDALNAVIYSLLRSRGDVAGAQSGSGLQEAIEQMARLANQQGGLNSKTGGLLPLVPQGGEQLLGELRDIARRERALAAELERLKAESGMPGAGQLAEDAKNIARELEAGRLNRETILRQEQLFRRLLDAGRTLRGDEEESEERVSETADPLNVRLPAATGVPERAARFPYPGWEELRTLSPEVRRLILDYFRRLNQPSSGARP